MRSRIVSPNFAGLSDLATIHTLSPECLSGDLPPFATLVSYTTNFAANLLVFIPLILNEPFVLSQFFWFNGTAVNGNTDVGIYTEDGLTKLISTGSTANSGTSAIQVVNVTDTTLPVNKRLWMAIGSDSATQRFLTYPLNAVGVLNFIGVRQQASGWSSGLPATISLDVPTANTCPLFGFTSGVI